MSNKQAIAEINAEIEDMKEVIMAIGTKVIGLSMQMTELQANQPDPRNEPHQMAELEDMNEYVMPKHGTIWVHGDGIRLMIEEVGGDMIVQAFKDSELEEGMPPFSMMRASK